MKVTRSHRQPVLLVLGVVALSAIGAWLSGQLLILHADPGGGGLLASMCRAAGGDGGGCAAVSASRFSQISLPVVVPTRAGLDARWVEMPIAFAGLAYFVFMGVWHVLIGGPRQHDRVWHRLPLHVGMAGAVTSMTLVALMTAGTAPWCTWCAAVHLVNLALVAAVWTMTRRAPSGGPVAVDADAAPIARVGPSVRHVATVLLLVAAVVGGLWVYRHDRLARRAFVAALRPYEEIVASLQEDPEFVLDRYHAQPRVEIPLRPSEQEIANRAVLVVFTDFQCPACYCSAMLRQERIAEHFGGVIDVRIRHYPLCPECNPDVTEARHEEACRAARALEAARRLGGEDAAGRMHDLLFEHHETLGAGTYRDLAARIGLDGDDLGREMDTPAVRAIVEADLALARRLKVTGTPTMFLDGRRVPELCDTPVFWAAAAEARAERMASAQD
jgi:protein-disulfide isomerase